MEKDFQASPVQGMAFPCGRVDSQGCRVSRPPEKSSPRATSFVFLEGFGVPPSNLVDAGLQPAERKSMRFTAIVLALALAGCYQPAYLTRETTVERDGDGKILRTIEREMVLSVIEIERMKPEMLKGIKIPEKPPITDQERSDPNGPWR